MTADRVNQLSEASPDTNIRPTCDMVIGLGSPHGDDQIGWLVCRELESSYLGQSPRAEKTPALLFRNLSGPIDMLTEIQGIGRLVLIDGCIGSGPYGTLCRWQWPDERIVDRLASSTHAITLPESLQLGAALNLLPSEIVIWTIEIAMLQRRITVSSELEDRVAKYATAILNTEFPINEYATARIQRPTSD